MKHLENKHVLDVDSIVQLVEEVDGVKEDIERLQEDMEEEKQRAIDAGEDER